jgi:hypothetical protein
MFEEIILYFNAVEQPCVLEEKFDIARIFLRRKEIP